MNKYMSSHAIMELREKENRTSVLLKEGGVFGFASDKPIKEIFVNGESGILKLTKQNENAPLTLYTIEVEAAGSPVEVTIYTC